MSYFDSMITTTSDKEKYYYKIGELEKITGVSSSKIRYWTNNYASLKNQLRSTKGYTHKLYHYNAIEIIMNLNKFKNVSKINSNYNNIDQKLAGKINRQIEIVNKLKLIKSKIEKLINTP